MGSSIEALLKEEGIFEGAQVQAVTEVVAWRLAQVMQGQRISKRRMAALLRRSRAQVDRLLSAADDPPGAPEDPTA
jgi:antitoxin HicB